MVVTWTNGLEPNDDYDNDNNKELPFVTNRLARRMARQCRKCGQPCNKDDGVLVRALGGTFHYDCFVCEDCDKPVVDKFYALEIADDDHGQTTRLRVVCEYHYYSHLGLICLECNEPIQDPVDGGLRYHPQCLTCPGCRLTPEEEPHGDPCYEYESRSYCHYHFSLLPGTHCVGCDQAILKQFVEHHDHPGKKWHPECYMIQKFWNVRLAETYKQQQHDNDSVKTAIEIREQQVAVEEKVKRIWSDLSAFEESSATCISDMLLHIAAGAYQEGVRMANQFVIHLEVLFSALDKVGSLLAAQQEVLECSKESRDICHQVIRFFQLLAQHGSVTGEFSVTHELLSLVTGMAHNLKMLIRIGLTESLRLERLYGIGDAIPQFLSSLLPLERKRVWMAGRYWFKDEPLPPLPLDFAAVDKCQRCGQTVEDECLKKGLLRWHIGCFSCSRCHRRLAKELQKARLSAAEQGVILLCNICCTDKRRSIYRRHQLIDQEPFMHITRLDQCVFLVKIALTRLYAMMISIPDKVTDDNNKPAVSMLHDHDTKINVDISKPQSSTLLRFMGSLSRRGSSSTMNNNRRRSALFGSVHLADVKRSPRSKEELLSSKLETTSSTPLAVALKRATSVREPPTRSRSDTPTISQRGIQSLRRALTTSNRKERRSLYGVFDRQRRSSSTSPTASPQQGSICTIDGGGALRTLRIQSSCEIDTTSTTDYLTEKRQRRHLAELTASQDVIVKHMAVLYMESMLRNRSFSTDELLSMIESKRVTIWDKLKAHIRLGYSSKRPTDGSAVRSPLRGTFGVPLAFLVARDNKAALSNVNNISDAMAACFSPNACIPTFVQNCILTLLSKDMSQEGVFRKNGNIRELNELCDAIDRDPKDLSYLNESPIQLAALLKRFLRELPEPLLTFKLYDLLLASTKMESEQDAKRVLHLACCMLPKPNRDTAQLLFLFLKWVASFRDTNKMDVRNLARVIAPTVLYSPIVISNKELTEERQQSARDEIKVVEMLIEYQEEFCMIPRDMLSALDDPKIIRRVTNAPIVSKDLLHELGSLFVEPAESPSTVVEAPLQTTANRRSWIPGRH